MKISEVEEKEELTPYNFQLFVYSPNRNAVGLHFTFDPSAMYKIGVLDTITRNFALKGIPIIHLAISYVEKGASHAVIFIDLADTDVNIDEMLLELRRYPYILDVKLLKPLFNGFIFDTYFFPLKVREERAVIFLRRGYIGLIKKAREQLGLDYELTLFLEGYNLSMEAFKEYTKIAGEDVEKLVKLGRSLFQHLGYGRIEIEEIDIEKGIAKLRIYDSFECELFKGSSKPVSHFIRGILAGWFTQLFKKGVTAKEIKCIAKGDSYCQFEVKIQGQSKV